MTRKIKLVEPYETANPNCGLFDFAWIINKPRNLKT